MPPEHGQLLKQVSRDSRGRAFTYAGWLAKCSRLLDAGALVDEEDENGNTPLMVVLGYGYVSGGLNNTPVPLIKTFLERGASVNKKNKNGQTPLMLALIQGPLSHSRREDFATKKEILTLLLEAGARVDDTDAFGRTVLDHVAQFSLNENISQMREIAELLEKYLTMPEKIPADSDTWIRDGQKKITHISVLGTSRRKLTDIFNFETRERVLISENLETHAESVTQPASFDDVFTTVVEEALDNFEKLSGTADRAFVLRGARELDKRP